MEVKMELKTRFQYTYFLHTFVINESKYAKYILKLLKEEKFKLRIFQKDKDLEIYTHFLPKIREVLFSTFELEDKNKKEKFDELPIETKAAVLAHYPSITFEYEMKKDMQGKTIDENSIFFKIQKVGIVLFNTGICFLYLKTNIEESENFADVLNFNYKFRDINQEYNNLKNYDKIKVQADSFENIQELQEFIYNITGPNTDALKLNLDIERFYTYSYACIKQDVWNVDTSFEGIKNDFYKYVNILPSDSNKDSLICENAKVIANSKFSKIGISKLGVNLLCSDCDIDNYTILEQEFEKKYFYTYILSLYLKVYLKKLNYKFKQGVNLQNTRKEFVEFTKNIWVQEVTTEDIGSLYYKDLKETLEIEKIYGDVKNKYDILYRELKIEKNEKISTCMVVILGIILLFNVLNFFLTLL